MARIIMVESVELSVVIPLYGNFELSRAKVSVQSVLSQRGISNEVIVSEQGERSRFPKMQGVRHIFNYYKPRADISDFNPGYVRNEAIALAKGEFVYTNDADIVFLDSYYLAKSVDTIRDNPNKALYRPVMKRLHIEDYADFETLVQTIGVVKAIESLDLSQEYIAILNGRCRKIRKFAKECIYPKTFIAFEEDFQEYVGNGLNEGREPMFWNENRHCGANLFRREQFVEVGGYSEEFINWGCEDSDLQWKLSEVYDLQFFPGFLEVLHLDHPKGYFSPEMWKRNEAFCARRLERGYIKAIDIDKRNRIW